MAIDKRGGVRRGKERKCSQKGSFDFWAFRRETSDQNFQRVRGDRRHRGS